MNLEFFTGYFWPVMTLFGLILIHEFGHYGAARVFGFLTPEFSVGLIKQLTLIRFKKWSTEFRITPVPVAGYVVIPELLSEDVGKQVLASMDLPKESYVKKPIWQRMIVTGAGPFANLVLAYFCILLAMVLAGYDFLPSISEAFVSTYENTIFLVKGICSLMISMLSLHQVDDVHSIFGILPAAKYTFEHSAVQFTMFVARLNICLAVFNLLPLTMLDGGKLVLQLIEQVLGERVAHFVENQTIYLSLAFLIMVIVLGVYNDFAHPIILE